MSRLVRRDNFFQDLFDFRRDFDEIFNRMISGWPLGEAGPPRRSVLAPPVESFIDKDAKTYHCHVALPGVDPKEVEIRIQGNTITISGERKAKRRGKELDLHYEEISYGAFERMLSLPEGVDADKLSAEYHNGVLELTAPVAAAALPRRIEVKTAPTSKQISA